MNIETNKGFKLKKFYKYFDVKKQRTEYSSRKETTVLSSSPNRFNLKDYKNRKVNLQFEMSNLKTNMKDSGKNESNLKSIFKILFQNYFEIAGFDDVIVHLFKNVYYYKRTTELSNKFTSENADHSNNYVDFLLDLKEKFLSGEINRIKAFLFQDYSYYEPIYIRVKEQEEKIKELADSNQELKTQNVKLSMKMKKLRAKVKLCNLNYFKKDDLFNGQREIKELKQEKFFVTSQYLDSFFKSKTLQTEKDLICVENEKLLGELEKVQELNSSFQEKIKKLEISLKTEFDKYQLLSLENNQFVLNFSEEKLKFKNFFAKIKKKFEFIKDLSIFKEDAKINFNKEEINAFITPSFILNQNDGDKRISNTTKTVKKSFLEKKSFVNSSKFQLKDKIKEYFKNKIITDNDFRSVNEHEKSIISLTDLEVVKQAQALLNEKSLLKSIVLKIFNKIENFNVNFIN